MKTWRRIPAVVCMWLLLVAGMATPVYSQEELEPNNSFGTASVINLNGSLQDTISPEDDVDWYQIVIEHQGALQVNITDVAPELNIAFRVRNADGSAITNWYEPTAVGGDTVAEADLPAPGRYYLEVHDGGDDAASDQPYSLQLAFTSTADASEPNDLVGMATDLAFGSPLQANILPEDDVDWYQIEPEHQGELQVVISNVAANLDIDARIWNANLNAISNWFAPLAQGGNTEFTFDLPEAGIYYLEVRDGGDDSRNIQSYTIQAAFTESDDLFEQNGRLGDASELPLGQDVPATILPEDDADWYQFAVDHHGELNVAITNVAPELDIVFRIHDASGRTLSNWFAPLASGGDTIAAFDLPAPGIYYMEVHDSGDDARSIQPYQLRADFTPAEDPFERNDSFGTASNIGVDREVYANILPDDDSDWYSMRIDHHGQLEVLITNVATELDMNFRVWNANLQAITNWFSPLAHGGDTSATIDLAPPGHYLLEVRDGGNDGRSIQPYLLRTKFTPAADQGEPNDTLQTAFPVGLDEPIVGNILPEDDSDWCLLEITEPGELHVLVTNVPPDLDIEFRLWNSEEDVVGNWQRPLAQGGNTEAVFPIEEPGTYYLELQDNGNDGRSIQPYLLYFSMQPIDPATVTLPPEVAPATSITETTGITETVFSTPTVRIRVSGQVGPPGVELFVDEGDDLLADGARLEVPPSALESYVTIDIGTSMAGPPDAPFGIFPAGYYWQLAPDELVFQQPVTLTLPIPSGTDAPQMFIGHWHGGAWVDLGGTIDNGLITAQTESFSTFAAFCGALEDYQQVRLTNDSSSPSIQLTYISGPSPAAPEEPVAEGCPPPVGVDRSWNLDSGDGANMLLRPGRYHIVVSYPQPQPGVANSMFFTVPPGGGQQAISIGDSGATSDNDAANIVFAGNALTSGTNVRPTIACTAGVPEDVPVFNADPVAGGLPSRIVVVDPIKREQLAPQGQGVTFSATATDPEGSQLQTYWTIRSTTGHMTRAGAPVASSATIADEVNFASGQAGRYTVFLTIYDDLGLFDECRWVINVVPNSRPEIEVFSGRVHVEFGRLDEERSAGVGPILPGSAALRQGVTAPVAVPSLAAPGSAVGWSGLTLCPAAAAGPLATMPEEDAVVTAPAPVDVMLPDAGTDATDRWANPGRTCVWALLADADVDPQTFAWEYPGPIFGSGTFYAAVDVPAGFHTLAPNGIPMGTFLRTNSQLEVYNAWVSALYNQAGIVPAIVWEAWDDPCPSGSGPENPCPTAISRGGLENIVATTTDGFSSPPRTGYTPIEVGPDAFQPNCANVLFFSELRPEPSDPGPGQSVLVTARISSLTEACPVRFQVSGTDGFSLDELIPTNKDGEASVLIPGGAEDVVDVVTASVCRPVSSDLATPPPPDEACTTPEGEPGSILIIEVTYTF